MQRMLDLILMTVGGWLGWVVGAWISFFTAFIVGMVGTGVGLYASRQVARRLLG